MEKIKQDLDKIAAQSRLLTVLFKNANKAKVESCMDLLKDSLVHWQISRDISSGVALHSMQQGIERVNKKFDDVEQSIATMRQARTAHHSSSRQIPPKPNIFYGRDIFVKDVVNILVSTTSCSESPRICIYGPARMGKTSAAIAVMEHPDIMNKFSENDRFWVPCVSATSPDILLQILYSNLRISRDTGDYLADIITELRSSPAPRLMLLDNFETPWDPSEGKQEDVETVLRLLSELSQLSILVAMRTNIPPSEQIYWINKPLGAVDTKTSYDIFCAIHPRAKGKPKLHELLVELGHMPYAVTLVASLGKASKSTPDVLLQNWRKLGPDILSSGSLEDSISRSIGLSINSKQIANNIPARTLLATLSMLPAGTTHSHLDWWAPELEDKKGTAISALNNVALVVDTEQNNSDEVLVSVLPVVQSYMQQRDRTPASVRLSVREACYKFVLEHRSSPGDLKFKNDVLVMSSEEVNIQAILLETTSITNTIGPHITSTTVADIDRGLEVLIAFSWYQHWTRPRTEVIEHTLGIARKVGKEPYIAECLFCLASTLFRLDRYDEAWKHYVESRNRFKRISNIVRASECPFELADLCLYMRKSSEAKKAIGDVSEGDMKADEYVRARRNLALGRVYHVTHEGPEALECLDAAKVAFNAMKLNRPVDAALCPRTIARVFGSMGRPSEALQLINQSLDIYEQYGPDYRLLETLIDKSAILLKAQFPDVEVLKTIQRTFQKGQELGRPLAIAQTLELFGEVYIRRRDVSSAQAAFDAAHKQYETMDQTVWGSDGISRCRYSCGLLAGMQENPDLEWHGELLSARL